MLIDERDGSDLGLACDAAVRILATRGARALSVRAIAGEMNLTGPALTHRWDNKARLSEPVIDAVHAAAVGLRDQVCSMSQPLARDRAERAWQGLVAAILPRPRPRTGTEPVPAPAPRARHAAGA